MWYLRNTTKTRVSYGNKNLPYNTAFHLLAIKSHQNMFKYVDTKGKVCTVGA